MELMSEREIKYELEQARNGEVIARMRLEAAEIGLRYAQKQLTAMQERYTAVVAVVELWERRLAILAPDLPVKKSNVSSLPQK